MRHYKFVLAAVLIILITVPPARGAQQAPAAPVPPAGDSEMILFQDLPAVLGASRYEQKSSEAPASVTVVTAEEIQTFGWRTLSEILRSVRGFFTTYDRNYSY